MSVEFSTREFEASHGKKPRGEGHWAFEFVGVHREGPGSNWLLEFAPAPLSLGEAKKWARARAQELECSLVKVCS